jgi:hypothetical protein
VFQNENKNRMTAQLTFDSALSQVARNANPAWAECVRGIVYGYATTHAEFVTDDFHAMIEVLPFRQHEKRALGAIMLKLSRDGVIEQTGRYVKSQRMACHYRTIPVWRSLICKFAEKSQ